MKNKLSRVRSLGAVVVLALACHGSEPQPLTPSKEVNTSVQRVTQTDLVATGTRSGAVNSYKARLPPANVVGTLTQTVEAHWDASLHNLKQAPTYPQGWRIEYYAGDAKLPQAPSTPADWASVSRIFTQGSVEVEAVDGERQALISTVQAPPVVVASNFSGNSAGDGWDVFFDPDYTRVFNIHHHSGPSTVMCRKLADSSPCAGYPIALTQTSNRATGRIDAVSNKLWQPTVTKEGQLAWDCVDLTTSARCSTPVVKSTVAAANSQYDNHMDPVVIGRKLYSLGLIAGGLARITCLDLATGTECTGLTLTQAGNSSWGLDAVGTYLYVLPGGNKDLDCYDSTTWTRCPGSWPKTVQNASGPVWKVASADGVFRNICTDHLCYSLDGSAPTLPPNFLTNLGLNPPGGFYAKAISLGTKATWSNPFNSVSCWDMATDTKCAPAFPIQVPRVYTSTLTLEDPDCLWTNGDDGIIRNYKISTGAAGCSGGPPRISFKSTVSIPRLGCDPGSRVYQYKSFKLIAPNSTQYTSATLTVKDSSGIPIPGFTQLPIPSGNPTVDLSALTVAVAGDTPVFDVAAVGFTDASVVPEGEFRVTSGSSPELCWDLSPSPPVCPTLPGIAGPSSSELPTTPVVAKGSYVLATATTDYTDQTLTSSVDNLPNFTNCGTQLEVAVKKVQGGSPVVGATVSLLDGTGNPVLDSTQKPVSEVSLANGKVRFPVWAAGYKVRLGKTFRYLPVAATVTAGGSGTTLASGETLTSNTVTTTASTPAHVDLLVDLDDTPPGPPLITGPSRDAVTYNNKATLAGTAEPGSTVTVQRDGQTACTAVTSPQGQWTCETDLPVGSSTFTATAEDKAGNRSMPSPAVIISRRNEIDPPVITSPSGHLKGPDVTVAGTGKPDADITVTDEKGNTVCTTRTNAQGEWQCAGTLSSGPHVLTAAANWQGFEKSSDPQDVTILVNSWYQGTGCSATGSPPALFWLLTWLVPGLLRRRRIR